jgi:predicted RNA-binding protein
MMNAQIRTFAGLVALALVAVGSVRAQKRMTPDEMIAALKPGQWLKVEGITQGDSSVICEEIQLLIGDFLDDEWSVVGVVQKIDKENRIIEILRLPIKIDEDAEFEHKGKGFKGIADLKVGMFLEVGGTYLKNGTFLASEVEDKSAKQEKENEIRVEGKVEKVDAAKHKFTLMGIAFQITDKARGRSAIK